jgi:hypothetical protein
MGGWPRYPVLLFSLALAACGGTSDESTPPSETRAESVCSEQCGKGSACGFLDGCVSFEDCRDGCVEQYAQEAMSAECLDAIEAFNNCFWSGLTCEQILASSSGAPGCGSELDAIGDPCSAGKSGFDKDRYVFVPLFCVYGPG